MITTRKDAPENDTNPVRGRGAIAASRQSARLAKAAARREAILEAALDEFSARGFAGARLEDVAKRAGVAKGTIYLYFADKEALFQELVRFQIGPVMSAFAAALASELPLKALIDQAIEIFTSEGPRFPALAEFYYREVLGPLLKAVRARLQRARERGEIADDALIRFPQLLGAATIMAVVWQGLFDRFEPLDARAMIRAYFDRLFAWDRRPG